MDAITVPGVGTFAVVGDPQGATISLFEGERR
jgi:predicted enzyme related to lactoylglutathione lyase